MKTRFILLPFFLLLAFFSEAQENSCSSLSDSVEAEMRLSSDSSSVLLFTLCVKDSECFEECFRRFAKEGGNIDAIDLSGNTLMDRAMSSEHTEQIVLLMKFDAQLKKVEVSSDMNEALSTQNEVFLRNLLEYNHASVLKRAFKYDFCWPTISGGYLQGLRGMPNLSFALNFQRYDHIPGSHYGIRAGAFAGLPKNPVKLAPYLSVEYRFLS